jgi:hypothetical protein
MHEVGLEARGVGGIIEQEEIPVEAQVELLADVLLETLQPPDRLEPDPDVQLVREQRAHAAGAVARRAAGERVALEQHRPPRAELGEVPKRGRPHHPTADHDHVRALAHGAAGRGPRYPPRRRRRASASAGGVKPASAKLKFVPGGTIWSIRSST